MRRQWNEWAPLPIRLIVGFGFAAHGWAKLSRGPAGFGEILHTMGIPLPHLAAWSTALLEFGGGLAILAGAFVTLVSVPLVIIMLVAMFEIHLPYGFSSIRLQGLTEQGAQFGPVGYELNLLYIAGLLVLVLGGSGAFSVDGTRDGRRPGAGNPAPTE